MARSKSRSRSNSSSEEGSSKRKGSKGSKKSKSGSRKSKGEYNFNKQRKDTTPLCNLLGAVNGGNPCGSPCGPPAKNSYSDLIAGNMVTGLLNIPTSKNGKFTFAECPESNIHVSFDDCIENKYDVFKPLLQAHFQKLFVTMKSNAPNDLNARGTMFVPMIDTLLAYTQVANDELAERIRELEERAGGLQLILNRSTYMIDPNTRFEDGQQPSEDDLRKAGDDVRNLPGELEAINADINKLKQKITANDMEENARKVISAKEDDWSKINPYDQAILNQKLYNWKSKTDVLFNDYLGYNVQPIRYLEPENDYYKGSLAIWDNEMENDGIEFLKNYGASKNTVIPELMLYYMNSRPGENVSLNGLLLELIQQRSQFACNGCTQKVADIMQQLKSAENAVVSDGHLVNFHADKEHSWVAGVALSDLTIDIQDGRRLNMLAKVILDPNFYIARARRGNQSVLTIITTSENFTQLQEATDPLRADLIDRPLLTFRPCKPNCIEKCRKENALGTDNIVKPGDILINDFNTPGQLFNLRSQYFRTYMDNIMKDPTRLAKGHTLQNALLAYWLGYPEMYGDIPSGGNTYQTYGNTIKTFIESGGDANSMERGNIKVTRAAGSPPFAYPPNQNLNTITNVALMPVCCPGTVAGA